MRAVLAAGALAGAGLLLLVLLLDRRPAPGPAALTRLDLDRRRFRRDSVLTVDGRHPSESLRMRRLGAQVREALEARNVRLPAPLRADLSITGRSIEAHIASTLLAATVGFFAPVLVGQLLSLLLRGGLSVIPLWLGLVGGIVGTLLPTAQVTGVAKERRRDFRHVVGSFLDLVAMNLSGGRGVPEALQSAATISADWAMVRIHDSLQAARLQGVTPWAALGHLGEDIQVDELRDLSAALGLVADDGAKVRDSLAARATSMRHRELADTEGRAQAQSQSMLVAQLLLCIGFLIFLTYPALARVLGGL